MECRTDFRVLYTECDKRNEEKGGGGGGVERERERRRITIEIVRP